MIVVTGGARVLRERIEEIAAEGGMELRAGSAPESGDRVIDLGLPPREWPSGDALIAAEAERVRGLAVGLPAGTRVARRSVLHASADAVPVLQRAQAAAEEAWRASGAEVVALRTGVLLGNLELCGAFRALVQRTKLVPVPGVARSRIEPLLDEDLARYCLEAAAADGPFDDIYDLGCGEILTGGLLARGLAENLGVGRWVFGFPKAASGAMAPLFARPDFPPAAVRAWLDVLAPGLLPRRMTAWDAFTVRPVELRHAMAYAVGMKYPLRKWGGEGRFGAWRAPERKGMLWNRPPGSGRRR